MTAAAPKISVVVPTYRRADLLDRCLKALTAQTLVADDYEIIVCDDGPSAQIKAMVLSHAALPESPRIRYAPVTATQGPAGARNVGWKLARAPIVAFTDDDTVPDADWLRVGLSRMTPCVDALSGRIVMPIPDVPSDYELDASHLQDAEFATANCMVRQHVLKAVGGFDPRYTMAWREDSDLHFALLERGYTIVREPAAVVVHPLRSGCYAAAIGMQRKVMFDTLLYKKYPRLYRQRIRRGLPWMYLALSGLLLVAVGALVTSRWTVVGVATGLWLVLTLRFLAKRLHKTRRDWPHVAETALTSIVIPPLSIFWRVVGSLKFSKGFP